MDKKNIYIYKNFKKDFVIDEKIEKNQFKNIKVNNKKYINT